MSAEQRIKDKFDAHGGEAFFGALVSKEPDRLWTFSGSCICYNESRKEAFEIHGAIYQRWLALGGLAFGVPCTDETSTLDGAGRFNYFNDGAATIFWHPNTGAHAIYGDIHAKWAAIGRETSVLGYPTTDEMPCPDGVGRFNHFQNGSIYWTPATGAHVIYGDIRERWSALGWETGYLGYPTSDEVDFPDGGRATDFQHGGIYWWPDTGAIDLRDVVVHYTGLHCSEETDWDQGSSADEPYAIISATTPRTATTFRTSVYDGVDAGEARPDLIELYRGRPYGINLNAVVMEQDFGDPERYRKEVEQVVLAVHGAGTVALGLIPLVGPIVAGVAGPALGSLMPHVASAVNDLFDWGDDRIGASTITISARDMVLLAARAENTSFNGIGFKRQSDPVTGLGSKYHIYYGIVPA